MSDAMQLQVMLTINDKLSKGLHPPTIALRKFAKEGGQALAVLNALQRQMSRNTTNSALEQQRKAVAALRKEAAQAATEIEKIKQGGRRGSGTTRQRSRGNLSEDLADDILLGGAGYIMVRGFRNGTNAAGDYEAAMLDLRNSFSDFNKESGKVDESKLARQLEEAGKQSVKLGNDLQGSTQDYVELYKALRQGGLQTEEILNGAGKAAAYLANVSGAIVQGRGAEQAEQLAQFFKMFQLQSQDFERSVNLFSALKDRFNIDSSDIIESSKYFQATATTLGMKGISGAEESSKLFAFLKRYAGMEGSQSGTAAQSLFTMFATHDKAVQELKKKSGIDLQLFDKKGQFLGMENAFKEMEKLRKLAPKQRMETLQEIFGEQGARVVGAMAEQGVEGWRSITDEANKAIPVTQKITAQMQTYNAKTEAVAGSWENLKATMFTPVMDWLKPMLDNANDLLGKLQEWSKAHPTIAKTATLIMGVGGAVLTVVAAIGALKTGMRVFQTFNKFSTVVDGLSNVETGAAGAEKKVGGLRSKLAGLNTLKLVGAMAALAGVAYGIDLISAAFDKYKETLERDKQASIENYADINKRAEEGKMDRAAYQREASAVLLRLDVGGQLKDALESERAQQEGAWFGSSVGRQLTALLGMNPYSTLGDSGYNPKIAASYFSTQARELSNPRVMVEALKQIRIGIPKTEDQERVKQALKIAFPESYNTAIQQLSMEQFRMSQGMQGASEEISKLSQQTQNLNQQTQNLSAGIQNAGTAAQNFANQVNSLKIQVPILSPAPSGIPKSAIGSIVQNDGLVYAHRGNVITPASLSRRSPGDWLDALAFGDRVSGAGSRNVSVTINVPAGSKAANDVRELATLVRYEVERAMENKPVMNGDHLAKLVAYSAARDSERL